MKPTPAQVDAAAEAILNARGMRRGVPKIINVLAFVPPQIAADAREDAGDALDAVGFVDLVAACRACLALFQRWASDDPNVEILPEEVDDIEALVKAAVAKAEGQTNV